MTQEQFIDKACSWLEYEGLTSDFVPCELTFFDVQEFIAAFRKAMSNSPEFEGIKTCNSDKNLQGFDAEYLQSKIDLHTKYMQEHGITSEQQLAILDEMRGCETATDCKEE